MNNQGVVLDSSTYWAIVAKMVEHVLPILGLIAYTLFLAEVKASTGMPVHVARTESFVCLVKVRPISLLMRRWCQLIQFVSQSTVGVCQRTSYFRG